MNHQGSLAKIHFERNLRTRGDWDSFAPHRKRVTELIVNAGQPEHRSLCVLGAGNGNDLDLASLAKRYDKITLADLDSDALQHCLARQGVNDSTQIETVAGVDLCGVLDLLDRVDGDQAKRDQAIERARHPAVPALATYDVVLSACLLTQIIDSAVCGIGLQHPRIVELIVALRDGHLSLIRELTSSGGVALLITDFVSSDTLPELKEVSDQELESLLAKAINEGNFFTGVNPGVLARRFGEISGAVTRLHHPWRWQMGDRAYGVCAVSMHASGPKFHSFV